MLQIIPPAPAERDDVPATSPVASELSAPEIPGSEFARIRTWMKYGITIAQVDKLYNANGAEIKRIVRKI